MNRYIDRRLSHKLQKESIAENTFDRFKLYYPDTYDKLIRQAKINEDVAVDVYKGIIRASNKRV